MRRAFRAGTSRATVTRHRWCAVALVVAAGVAVAGPASASEHGEDDVQVTATVEGRDITDVDANNALRLDAEEETTIRIEVDNLGDDDLVIRSLRLDAKVIGLTFFSYETRIDLSVEPGESGDREFDLDLIDLGSQANGLLPARLALLDEDRDVVASQRFPADVRGSFGSVYNIFGLVIAGITAVLFAFAIVGLTTHRLSPNRWRRGIRFGLPGLGFGLTLIFTLSTLRVLTPSPTRSGALVLILGAVLFMIGYFTPTPDAGDDIDIARADGGDREPLGTLPEHSVATVASGPGAGALGEAEASDTGNVIVQRSEPPPPPRP